MEENTKLFKIEKEKAYLILYKAMMVSKNYKNIVIIEKAIDRHLEMSLKNLKYSEIIEINEKEYDALSSVSREFNLNIF